MADWLTHILLALAAFEAISLRYPKIKDYRPMFLIAAILPDLGNFTLFLGEFGSKISTYFYPLHSPLGIILLIGGISFVFSQEHRRNILLTLMLGSGLHLILDFFVISLNGKIPLFFPLSFETRGFGVFYQGGWIFPIISVLAVLIVFGAKFLMSRRGCNPTIT